MAKKRSTSKMINHIEKHNRQIKKKKRKKIICKWWPFGIISSSDHQIFHIYKYSKFGLLIENWEKNNIHHHECINLSIIIIIIIWINGWKKEKINPNKINPINIKDDCIRYRVKKWIKTVTTIHNNNNKFSIDHHL